MTTPAPCAPVDGPKLSVTLARKGDSVVAVVTNVGCKPAYRVQGCCGEGAPIVEQRSGAGAWALARCQRDPTVCCGARPVCTALRSGAVAEIRVEPLSAALCCGTTYRVGIGYYAKADCAGAHDAPALIAYSNALKLRDHDPCPSAGTTPCGSTTCKSDSEVCVQLAGWKPSYACRPVPPKCVKDRSCSCLGAQVCGSGGYVMCTDVNTPNTVSCECPNC